MLETEFIYYCIICIIVVFLFASKIIGGNIHSLKHRRVAVILMITLQKRLEDTGYVVNVISVHVIFVVIFI
jgi:hypothetical protein